MRLFLKEIFPSFGFYVIAAIGIGIPLLTIIGWVHWKKSGARRAEVDVNYEANPYEARTMVNTEMVLKLSLQLSEILLKNQNKNTISENEINSIKSLIKEIENHNSKRTFTNKMDIKYIRTETQERTNS